MTQLTVAILFIALLLVSLPLRAVNMDRPLEKIAFEFHQRLIERKFEELERMAEDIRKNDTKTSDGQPLLAALYGGISGCFDDDCSKRAGRPIWADGKYKLLLAWREMAPSSVTAELAIIYFFKNRAWDGRGSKFANEVKAAAWRVFRHNLDRAQEHLEKASKAAKNDPGWYAASLAVGMGSGWPKQRFDNVFKEGIAKYPLYLPLYFEGAAYYAPRWHGSKEEYRQFIEEAINQTRPQLGETLYARLHWSLWTREMFKDGTADWPRMRAAFETIVKEYREPWNVNNFAKFACMAGDRTTFSRLAKEIGDHPIGAVWGKDNNYYASCTSYAAAHTAR